MVIPSAIDVLLTTCTVPLHGEWIGIARVRVGKTPLLK